MKKHVYYVTVKGWGSFRIETDGSRSMLCTALKSKLAELWDCDVSDVHIADWPKERIPDGEFRVWGLCGGKGRGTRIVIKPYQQ